MPECPVCHNAASDLWSVAKDYEYFTSDKAYEYFICKKCHSIFIDPLPLAELKQIYPPNYYSFVNQKQNIILRIKEWLDKKYFQSILKKLHQPEIKILDVGGGTGWLSNIIREMDKRVVFTQIVDIDPKAKLVAESNGHQYFEGTLESFETEEKFDIILMFNLIEHVSSPGDILKKVSLLLNTNGIVLIKTPNTDCWDSSIFRKSYWGGLHCPRHWVIFSESGFRTVIEKTSLNIQSLKYTQGAPFWAFSLIVYLHKKKWISVSAEKPVINHFLFSVFSGLFAAIDFVRCRFVKTAQMLIILENNNEVQ